MDPSFFGPDRPFSGARCVAPSRCRAKGPVKGGRRAARLYGRAACHGSPRGTRRRPASPPMPRPRSFAGFAANFNGFRSKGEGRGNGALSAPGHMRGRRSPRESRARSGPLSLEGFPQLSKAFSESMMAFVSARSTSSAESFSAFASSSMPS